MAKPTTISIKKKGVTSSVTSKDFQDIDIYRSSISWEDLETIRVTLAKRANQRLLRLEREVSPVTGERYSEWGATDYLVDYLQKQGKKPNKKGQLRVTERRADTSANYDALQAKKEIMQLQKFLNSPSSKVSQQKSFERARLEAFKEVGHVTRSGATRKRAIQKAYNKRFYDFLNSETFKKLATVLSSEQIIEVYDQFRQQGVSHFKIMESFEEYLNDAEISEKSFEDLTIEYKGNVVSI